LKGYCKCGAVMDEVQFSQFKMCEKCYMEEEENCSTCQHFKGIGIPCTRKMTTMSPYNLRCNYYIKEVV
jgi:hypothetical protein